MRTVYFDYNATTPLDGGVRESMLPLLGDHFGNPSSVHHLGQKARALLDAARERVASVWDCGSSEVVFTSGGTESINLALFGVARRLRDRGRHLITSAIEHHAVLHPLRYLVEREGFSLTRLPVGSDGLVDPASLIGAFQSDTILVSIMAANNEVGSIQAVSALGGLCRERGIVFHTDAVQWMGKEPFGSIHDFQADLVSVCAHKFHGPKGAGALFIRSPLRLNPLLFGGGHENERRAGTENLAMIVGLAEATDKFVREPVFDGTVLGGFKRRLQSVLKEIPGVVLHANHHHCLANTLAFSVAGVDSASLLAALDLEGICASSGSACSSGSVQPSHVLLAMGVNPELAGSLVRFSLGRENTRDQIEFVLALLPRIIQRCRSAR